MRERVTVERGKRETGLKQIEKAYCLPESMFQGSIYLYVCEVFPSMGVSQIMLSL